MRNRSDLLQFESDSDVCKNEVGNGEKNDETILVGLAIQESLNLNSTTNTSTSATAGSSSSSSGSSSASASATASSINYNSDEQLALQLA